MLHRQARLEQHFVHEVATEEHAELVERHGDEHQQNDEDDFVLIRRAIAEEPPEDA